MSEQLTAEEIRRRRLARLSGGSVVDNSSNKSANSPSPMDINGLDDNKTRSQQDQPMEICSSQDTVENMEIDECPGVKATDAIRQHHSDNTSPKISLNSSFEDDKQVPCCSKRASPCLSQSPSVEIFTGKKSKCLEQNQACPAKPSQTNSKFDFRPAGEADIKTALCRIFRVTANQDAMEGDYYYMPSIDSQAENNFDYCELVGRILVERLSSLERNAGCAAGASNKSDLEDIDTVEYEMMSYLCSCYERLSLERSDIKYPAPQIWLDLLLSSCQQCASFAGLVLEGVFTRPRTIVESSTLLKFLIPNCKLPHGFLCDLVYAASKDEKSLSKIFVPVVMGLMQAVKSITLADYNEYQAVYKVMTELCDIKFENRRPICRLLTTLPTWLPAAITKCSARELERLSVLGPFFGMSLFADDCPRLAEKYFAETPNQYDLKMIKKNLQRAIQFVRV
ncbi:Ubiquitin conjugation factor E4 B [Trichoplax sp. H2]|nr:Ubiquitin conjugation factor E4 B [Trichoplax sp. H2]|eukprot:RDD42430.1 Ubiquitin conjugation factor E4 B [Trichoplax sp. H2]